MFFAQAMDDTSMTSIRRSIFLFTSFIGFTAFYELEIQPSAKIFGILQIGKNSTISSEALILFACLIQAYLCIRLYIARPIAFALLQKSWGLEELKSDDKFAELSHEIEKMVENSKTVTYPKTDNLGSGLITSR